jgi:endonuclease/exonuclease/phosphatase (EEP) superfamily protein YafD
MSATDIETEAGRETPAPAARPRWYRTRWVRVPSWIATGGVAAYTLIRLFGLDQGWFLVATIAFIPYLAVAALAGAGLQAGLRHWRAAAATTVCALALGVAIAPRAVSAPQQFLYDAHELRVMSVNLYVGQAELERIVDWVDEYDIDVLSVQELTPWAYDELVALGIEERLGHVIAEPGWAADGTAIYSRHPLERLPESEPGGIFHQLAARITLPDGTAFRFMAVHTAAPYAPHRIPLWESDFAALPRPDGGEPWVLAGDFNATLDHRRMRELIGEGYKDVASSAGEGLTPTWRPLEGRVRGLVRPPAVTLDRVLVETSISVQEFAVLPGYGSDHRPVRAVVQLPGGGPSIE